MTSKTFKVVIVDGEPVEDYFVCNEGFVWSRKYGNLRKLKSGLSASSPYPKYAIMVKGKHKSFYAHRLVAQAWHDFPIPPDVTESEWQRTPKSVRKLVTKSYQVNHIDHNHKNHHPTNLEWSTVQQNAMAYQRHRLANV